MSHRLLRLKAILLLVILIGTSYQGFSQFNIDEPFNTNSTNINLTDNAYLTSGTDDPAEQGWLRLTKALANQKGSMIVQQAFPSNLGVLIDFEYKTWGGNGADGMSVFLFNADSSGASFHIGNAGGALGYGPTNSNSNTGLSGAYMGLGLDEWGNYSVPGFFSSGTPPPTASGPGSTPNAIALRGPAPTYTYIAGTQVVPSDAGTGDNGGIDYNTYNITTRPSDSQFYRRVQISLQSNAGLYTATVKWKRHTTDSFSILFGPVTITTPPPAMLQLGIASSTGSHTNYHEIRNLTITTPGNISVTMMAPALISTVPNPTHLNYDITVQNLTTTRVTGINIQDLLPPDYTVNIATDLSVTNYGDTSNTITNFAVNNGIFSGTASLASNAEITLHVNGTITNLFNGQSIRNTVKINAPSIVDVDTTNNVDTAYTLVQAPIPLPLKLNSFTVLKQQNDVNLTWATDADADNDHFDIERSEDGKIFNKVGTVQANETTGLTIDYQFKDVDALSLKVLSLYYRLLQVDKSGAGEYSTIKMITMDHPGNDLSIQAFPVPFTNVLTLQLSNATVGQAFINMHNAAGQEVYRSKIMVTSGACLIQLNDVGQMPKGVYTLEYIQDSIVKVIQVTK